MSFKKWLEGYDKEYNDYMVNSVKRQMPNGMVEFKDKENKIKVIGWSGWDEKTLHLYNAYKTERTTKRLVWATWALVIVTWLLVFKEEILFFLSFFVRLFTQA